VSESRVLVRESREFQANPTEWRNGSGAAFTSLTVLFAVYKIPVGSAIAALRAHDWMRIIRYVRGIRVPKVGRTGRNDLKNGNSPKLR
jgi:hypothetical protein